MRKLILAATALTLLAAPAYAATKKAEAPAADAKTERHYDCSKKGNANKAECKGAANAPSTAAAPAAPAKPATAAAPQAKPAAPVAKTAPAAKAAPTAAGTRTPSPAQLANQNKMKACGAQWDKFSEAQKAEWKTKGEKFKDKNGKPYTGWIAFSIECRKK